jgi:uncharacterized protein
MTQDLTPPELDELDDLLRATPGGLEAMDVSMLDGYLCGVLVQPDLLQPQDWLAHVFDAQAKPLPAEVDPVWHARTCALVNRRLAALRRAISENQWFDPLVLHLEEGEEVDDDPAFVALPAYSKPLVPFASGFVTAINAFPNGLLSLIDDAAELAMDRVVRHLPCSDDEEREAMAALDQSLPLKNLDDAVEDLVHAIVELDALTEPERYRVTQVVHETPKVGRNDPCPCGSDKKYKACHGA